MKLLTYLDKKNINYSIEEDGKVVISGDLDLEGTQITELPNKLSVDGYLDLSYTNITELPGDLSVGGYLDLSNTPITKLPEGLSVGEDLILCETQITELPDDLSVGGYLDLRDTPITKLPEDLIVKGGLFLDTEKITNISYCRDVKSDNCPLFAAYVNGEIQISFGCFLGNIEAFEAKFYDIYTPMSFNKIKQATRECIKELEEMRKGKTK